MGIIIIRAHKRSTTKVLKKEPQPLLQLILEHKQLNTQSKE